MTALSVCRAVLLVLLALVGVSGLLCPRFVPARFVPAAAALWAVEKQPWVDTRPEPKTARERVSFKNKVPFSDDMYETLKRTIELLSKRARTDPDPEKLTVDEAVWLKGAVEVILEDAKRYGPPPRPERVAQPPPPQQATATTKSK